MHTQPMGAGSSFHSTSPNSATPHLPPRPLLLFAGFDFFSWCQLQGPKSGWGWLLGGQLGLDSRVWCYGQDGCREGLQRLGAASGLGVWQERCRGGHLWPGGQGSRILNAESRGVNQGGLARCQGQRLGCRGQWWGWGQGLRGIGHYWNRNDSQWGGGGKCWWGCWWGCWWRQRQGWCLDAGFLHRQGMGQPGQAAGLLLLLFPLQAKTLLLLYAEGTQGLSQRDQQCWAPASPVLHQQSITHPLTLCQSGLSDTSAPLEMPQISIHTQPGSGLSAGGTAMSK